MISFYKPVIRKALKRDVFRDGAGALNGAAVVAFPLALREDDGAGTAGGDHGGDHQVGAEHELVGDPGIAAAGEAILERGDDGFSGLGGQADLLHDVVLMLLPDLHRFEQGVEMFFVEDSPGGHGELHHRHQRMGLGRTDDEILIRGRGIRQEGGEGAAADHVGAGIPVSQQVGGHHLRDQHADGVPGMGLVMQALDDGLAAAFPGGPEFIVGILVGELHEQRALLPWRGRLGRDGVGREEVEVPRVELEAVDAIGVAEVTEPAVQPGDGLGVGEVELGGYAVPPGHGIDLA